jgi:uncharacterized small protein (DUF1192 family)
VAVERAMDIDDLQPRRPVKDVTLGEPLSTLSVPELEERLARLDVEKVRVEAEITVKRRAREAANAIFGG